VQANDSARSVWIPAYVALGSNLDEPHEQVERGFAALERLDRTRFVSRSRLYASKPFGSIPQPDFVNAAAGVLTQLSVRELLRALKELEASLGRARPIARWGPRLIDLDLLVYADAQVSETDLTVPHPGIPERNFVLYPLCDIAPDLVIPGMGIARELAMRVRADGLHVLTKAR
jgi:2-amino-4-hydroxy-6-hydroxymethyldihydropteridine diphosphokinase